MGKIAEVGSVSVKFTGDDTDLRAKFKASKEAVKQLEDAMLKASKIRLAGTEQKIKLTLDTAEANKRAAEFRSQMAQMRAEKLELNLNTQKAKAELTGFQAFSSSMLGKITLGNIIAGGALAAVGALNNAIGQLNQTLNDSVNVSAKYEVAMKGLSSISKAFGQDANSAQSAAQSLASDGLISVTQAAQTLKNLMSTGFSLSESMQIATSMKDIGAFNNVIGDLGQAMVDASKGTKTGSIELIENIGLTEKLSAIMKRANIDISNGIDLTNNAAQRQAFLNAVLREGARNFGSAAEYSALYSGKVDQAKASIVEMQKSLGELIKPAAQEWQTYLKWVADGYKAIFDEMKNINDYNLKTKETGKYIAQSGGIEKMKRGELVEAQGLISNIQENLKKDYLRFNVYMEDPITGKKIKSAEYYKKLQEDINKELEKQDRVADKIKEVKPVEVIPEDIKKKNSDVITMSFNLDKESLDYFEKFYGNVIALKQEINTMDDVDKQINAVENAMSRLNTTTEEGVAQFQSMSGLLEKLKIDKVEAEERKASLQGYASYYNTLGKTQENVSMQEVSDAITNRILSDLKEKASKVSEPISGYDPSKYYAGVTGETTLEGIKNFKETNKEAEKLKKNIGDVGNSLSELGDIMQNDFIKALGSVGTNIQSLTDNVKMVQTGGMSGVVGGIGIATAVVSIGATLLNALMPATEKQLTAAQTMNEAAETIKNSFQDKGVQYLATKGAQDLSKLRGSIEKSLSSARKTAGEAADAARSNLWSNPTLNKMYDEAKKRVKDLENSLAGVNKQLKDLEPAIKQTLGLTWQDMGQSVRGAFDAANLSDFYSQFKAGLTDTIKNALITAFLQSDAMIKAFEGLSSDIYNTLSESGFDISQISEEQMKEWRDTINKMSTEGAAFFEILQKLGLAGESVTDSLNSMSNTVNSIPQGVKVSLYRYQALPTSVGGAGTNGTLANDGKGDVVVNVKIGDKPIKDIIKEITVTDQRIARGA